MKFSNAILNNFNDKLPALVIMLPTWRKNLNILLALCKVSNHKYENSNVDDGIKDNF
ncbi:hypothetical protein DSUL_20496 [Desulfovibrionales bacterium]